MEEGATNEDLDLDDDDNDDVMDVASDEDNAVIYVTAGGIPPPPLLTQWSGGGSCHATTTPPSSSFHGEKKSRRRGERAMDEGYDDDEGGRRRGGKGGGRASGRATTVAAASIANEVLVVNLGKIADKGRAAPVAIAPPASSSGEGRDGGVFVFVVVASTDVARRHTCSSQNRWKGLGSRLHGMELLVKLPVAVARVGLECTSLYC